MAKDKQLRARVDVELYERVQNKTSKMSDFVRNAVIEKLEKEEYGDQSQVAVEIRQLELLLQNRQSIISQYEDLIKKEQSECDRIAAQIKEKQKVLDRNEERENRIKNDPTIREEFESTVIFLLRKKYLQLEANVNTVLTNKANKLRYANINMFREDMRKYIDAEWPLGRKYEINSDLKTFVEADYNYVTNKLK